MIHRKFPGASLPADELAMRFIFDDARGQTGDKPPRVHQRRTKGAADFRNRDAFKRVAASVGR